LGKSERKKEGRGTPDRRKTKLLFWSQNVFQIAPLPARRGERKDEEGGSKRRAMRFHDQKGAEGGMQRREFFKERKIMVIRVEEKGRQRLKGEETEPNIEGKSRKLKLRGQKKSTGKKRKKKK